MTDKEKEKESRLEQARVVLQWRLNKQFAGRKLTASVFQQINQMIIDHRARCRLEGIDFPALAALVVPRLNAIDLVNAELEGEALDVRIVGFMRKTPEATPQEIVQAVAWAFPNHRQQREWVQ